MMSLTLRIALILVSFVVVMFVLRKVRKTQLNIDDAIYWIIASFLLLVLSIFPQLAIWASELLGIESAANFVFLFMIFVILVKLFNMAIDLSILKQRLNRFIEKQALINDENKNKSDK